MQSDGFPLRPLGPKYTVVFHQDWFLYLHNMSEYQICDSLIPELYQLNYCFSNRTAINVNYQKCNIHTYFELINASPNTVGLFIRELTVQTRNVRVHIDVIYS